MIDVMYLLEPNIHKVDGLDSKVGSCGLNSV